MNKVNSVFIAQSLDGYITDKYGGLNWLHSIPNINNDDMGYNSFIAGCDAIIMGRKTFETVCGFDVEWPYEIPVFVLSNTLKSISDRYTDKAVLINGPVKSILSDMHQKGYSRLYIDGGTTIQEFLKEDLIDELIITTFPVLLGGGSRLFSELPEDLTFGLEGTRIFLGEIVQTHYKRKRVNP